MNGESPKVAVARRLLALGRAEGWHRANPYVLKYLALHARDAALLAELVEDVDYLAAADPDVLRSVVGPLVSELPETARVFLAVSHRLHGVRPDDRSAVLELASQLRGSEVQFRRPAGASWWPRWIEGSATPYHRAMTGHVGRVNAVCTAGVAGTQVAVSAGDDGTLRVWRLADGELLSVLEGHIGPVECLAAVGDGRGIVASGGVDGLLRRWDVARGVELHAIETAHRVVHAIATDEYDDRVVATAGRDGSFAIWDVAHGRLIRREMPGHEGAIHALAIRSNKDGSSIVTGGSDGRVRLCRPAGEVIVLGEHDGWVLAAAITTWSDRAVALTTGDDGRIAVWDLATSESLASSPQVSSWGRCLRPLSGSRSVLLGSTDKAIHLWDPDRGFRADLRGHTGEITGLAIADGDEVPRVVSSSGDGTVRLWSVPPDPTTLTDAPTWDRVVALQTATVDRRRVLLSAGAHGVLRSCDLSTGRGMTDIAAVDGWIGDIAASEVDGVACAVIGGSDRDLHVFPLDVGQPKRTLRGHQSSVIAVDTCVVGGRSVVISASDDGTVRSWDLSAGAATRTFVGHAGGVRTVAALQPGDQGVAVSGGVDGTVRAWDLFSGAAMWTTAAHDGWTRSVASMGSDLLVSGGDDGAIRIWRRSSGELIDELLMHSAPVLCVAVARWESREVVVAAAQDGTAFAIDADSGAVWRVPVEGCLSVAFDDGVLAIGTQTGLVVIDLHEGQPTALAAPVS